MGEEAKIAEREICKFLAIFLCKCKMAITDIVKICSYLVAGKWKAFYTHRRIPNPILSSAPTNTSALHYGLILIQLGSRVTAISSSSTATSSMVRTTSSMVTETKSVVLFRLQVYSQRSSLVLFNPANTTHPCRNMEQ